MDRETTQRCCLKDPQGSGAPNCHRNPQVGLHSPVLQHRGDGHGVLGARGSSSFLKLPWGRCVWGEGWRLSPAGPGSCGAALGGTALPTPAAGQEAQGEQLSPAWDGHPKCAASPCPPLPPRAWLCVCVQQGWSQPGAAHPALLCLGGDRDRRACDSNSQGSVTPGRGERKPRGKAGPLPQTEQDSVSPSTAEGGSSWGRSRERPLQRQQKTNCIDRTWRAVGSGAPLRVTFHRGGNGEQSGAVLLEVS